MKQENLQSYVTYTNYEAIDQYIETDLDYIEKADLVYLNFDVSQKKMLFTLGVLFAAGKKISITNPEDLKLDTGKKCFDRMANYWASNNLEPMIINETDENKKFLICPVKDATSEQLKIMSDHVTACERQGYIFHDPNRDTNQDDSIGYRICTDNANAIGASKSVDIFYSKTSKGSLFDLGVAYYLRKPLILINQNEIVFDENDFGDRLIMNWPTKSKTLVK